MYNDDNSGGNNGHKGRFRERLQKIRKDKVNFKNRDIIDNDDFFFLSLGRNILKVVLVLPSVIYSHINVKKSGNNNKKNNAVINEENNLNINYNLKHDDAIFVYNDNQNVDIRFKVNKIKDMDLSLLKAKREYYDNVKKINDNKYDIEIQNLQKEIINLIKKKLVKNINELEILQSELYVLNQMESGDIFLNECQQDIKEIKKLLSEYTENHDIKSKGVKIVNDS